LVIRGQISCFPISLSLVRAKRFVFFLRGLGYDFGDAATVLVNGKSAQILSREAVASVSFGGGEGGGGGDGSTTTTSLYFQQITFVLPVGFGFKRTVQGFIPALFIRLIRCSRFCTNVLSSCTSR